MDVKLSNEQQLIVDAPISNILVSAAAGSGKTTVLVERIVTKILEGAFDVDGILVMTFTREAANNMRVKLEDALRKKIKELKETGDKEGRITRLYRQLDLLPNSYIQTIDAFCSRVIKEKGYVCADDKESELLESGSVVLDNNELKVLLINAVNLSISEMYGKYKESNEAFLTLTNMYGNGRTDDSLAESLAESYRKLRSLPEYLKRCDDIVSDREVSDANGEIRGLDEIVDLVLTLYRRIDSETINALRNLTLEIQFVKGKKNIERQQLFFELFDLVEEYVNKVKDTANSGDSFDVIEVIRDRYYLDRFEKRIINGLVNPDGADNSDVISRYNYLFAPIAALISYLKPYIDLGRMPGKYNDYATPYVIEEAYRILFTCDKDDLLRRQKERTAIIREYVNILKIVDENFMRIKARVKGVDFADQTHLAYKILSFDEARLYYDSKFSEIYIDEYQDNSEIQDKIIELITHDKKKIFRVGDVKQSIYKFRYAEPKMFIDKMNAYSEVKTKDDFGLDSAGLLFLLNNNFRSDKTVINFINEIFYPIMTAEGAEISYDEKQQLNFPEVKAAGELAKPRVLLVNSDDNRKYNKQAMCYGVLKEVELLKESGINDGEICVLTRKHAQADLVSSYLNEHGHKAVYADELSVFDDSDIHSICNVIMSLGNSYRDEYLLGILISPYAFSNFTLDEVSRIIAFANRFNPAMKSQALIEKVRIFSEEAPEGLGEIKLRAKKFIDTYDSLRNDQIITDIGELTDRIFKESGIGATLGNSSPKLNMFKDWLCSNFLRYGSDISRIATELESMKIKLGSGASVSSKAASSPDAIKCMTYHASKGLEFKAVIVTELNASVKADKNSQILFDARNGFVSDDYIEETVRLDESIEMMTYKNNQLLYDNAEILRLLYVALTRAKDRLSVVLPIKLDSSGNESFYRIVSSNKENTYDKYHWLKCKKSMEYAFLSGLLKLKGSYELNSFWKELVDPANEEAINYSSTFDEFDLEIDTPDFEELDSQDYETEEGDDSSDKSEDFVEIKFEEKESLIPLNNDGFDEDGYPVFEKYPYEDVAKYPFKVSVSGIKDGLSDATMPVNLTVNGLSYFMARMNGDVGETPSELGTFVHKLLRFVDLKRIAGDINSYEAEIDSLIEDKVISSKEKEKAMRYKDGIFNFAKSDIGSRLISSDEKGLAYYEKPVVFSIPVGDKDDVVLVQGIIDLLFEEDGEYVLIDYKTDSFPKDFDMEKRSSVANKNHSSQINYYKNAVEVSGMRIKESYLYLVNYNQFVCV